jgi:hypothetical protein
MAKYKKGKLKGIETHADIFEKLGGGSGGSRSKLKIKKKPKPEENIHPDDWENFFGDSSFKPSDSNLKYTKRLLEHHGVTENNSNPTAIRRASGTGFQVLDDNPKSFKIRIFEDVMDKGSSKTMQTTLTSPSLGKILNMLGY